MEDAVAFEATMSAEVSLTILDLIETMLSTLCCMYTFVSCAFNSLSRLYSSTQ
jgi:hypothetical protein